MTWSPTVDVTKVTSEHPDEHASTNARRLVGRSPVVRVRVDRSKTRRERLAADVKAGASAVPVAYPWIGPSQLGLLLSTVAATPRAIEHLTLSGMQYRAGSSSSSRSGRRTHVVVATPIATSDDAGPMPNAQTLE